MIDSRCPEDEMPEAMHHQSLPVYGVQWHPERMCLEHARPDTVDGLKVLQFFIRYAARIFFRCEGRGNCLCTVIFLLLKKAQTASC